MTSMDVGGTSLRDRIAARRAAQTGGGSTLADRIAARRAALQPNPAADAPLNPAPDAGFVDRARDTATSFTAGVASGITMAAGQIARLGQAANAAAENPLRAGATAAVAGLRMLQDPVGTITGQPTNAAGAVAPALDAAAGSIPRAPLGAGASLTNALTGGIADSAGLVGSSVGALAPRRAYQPFTPEAVAMGIGQTLPMQTASMGAAALGGPVGSFGASWVFESASIVDDTYRRLKQQNPGMSDQDALERAFLPSVVAAIPAAALDAGTGGEAAIARNMATDQAEQVAKGLAARVLHAGKEIGRSAIEEALTEPIQGVIEQVGTTAAAPAQAPVVAQDIGEFINQRAMEAIIGGTMGGFGGAAAVAPGAFAGQTQPGRPAQVAPAPKPAPQPGPDRFAAAAQAAESRLGGAPASEPASAKLTDEEVARLGLVRQEAPAAKPGDQPSEQPAGRQASTLAELLRDDSIAPQTRKSLAERYAAGELTREDLAAMLETLVSASPEEKLRREFEAMAARGSESSPPPAAPVAETIKQEGQPAEQGVQQGAGPVESVVQAEPSNPDTASPSIPDTTSGVDASPRTGDFAAMLRQLQDERNEVYPAGDAMGKLAKQASTESLVSLYKWTRTQHSEVNRWLGGAAAAELRARGETISEQTLDQAPMPSVTPRTVDRYSGQERQAAVKDAADVPQRRGAESGALKSQEPTNEVRQEEGQGQGREGLLKPSPEKMPENAPAPAAGALSKPQVSFRSMPPYAVRKTLKDAGFAFDKESRAWIGPDTDEARKVAAEVEAGRKSAVANKPAQEPAKQGDTAATPEQPAKPTKKYTDTLRAVAQSKREKAEEKLNRDRLTNTARRARMADSVENDARREIAVAKLAEKVADAVDAGEAPELRNIRAIAEIEDLLSIAQRAKYDYARSLSEADRERRYPGWQRAGFSDAAQMIPITDALGYLSGAAQPSVHTADYRGFIEKVGTLPKSKQAVAELRRWMGDAESRTYISASNYDTIVKWASKLSTRDASDVMDASKDFARRRRITNDGEINLDRIIERLEMLRSGVKAPTVDKVTQLERALAGQGGVGIDFFPTPPELARRMVEMAGVESGMKVLEPSAGNGHIADAIKAAGVTPDVVEVSSTLREILNAKGYEPVAGDFLEYNPGPVYDRIVMNPPFSDRLDVAHVTHAMKLLKPGGRIVAIVGEGPFFGTDKKAQQFRSWLDGLDATSEKLPSGTFMEDQKGLPTTQVASRIVTIDKPAETKQTPPAPAEEPKPAPQKEPTNVEQPAPEPVAEAAGAPAGAAVEEPNSPFDPTDHGAVTWDSADNEVERRKKQISDISDEIAALKKKPDSAQYGSPTNESIKQLEEQKKGKVQTLGEWQNVAMELRKLKAAYGDGQVGTVERAAELVKAWHSFGTLGIQNVPTAALRAIRRAERMLLERADVGGDDDTTMYVWSDALAGKGQADRVKLAKSFAEKMKKEGEASRREMARIDKRGAMVTPAGKVVARPDPSPTVTDPDKKPTVKAFKTDAERIGGISVATSRETSRYAINGVLVAKGGTEIAATDGRRLFVHNRPEGFGVDDGLYLDADGNDVGKGVLKNKAKEGTFPPYADIISNYDSSQAIGRFDPVEIASMARRAAVMTNEESRGILFMVGRKGAKTVAGMYGLAPDVGEVWVGEGAEVVFGINPGFLIDAMQWHAKNGSETVDIYSGGPTRPIVIVGADGTVSVIMPVEIGSDAVKRMATEKSAGNVADREFRASQVNDQALEDIRKRMSSKPEAPKSTGKGTKGNPKKRGFSEMADAAAATLDRVAESARERMRRRDAQGVTFYANPFLAPEFYASMRDVAIVAAAKALSGGIKGGRALTALVAETIEKNRPDLASRAAEVRKIAAKMIRTSAGDPDRFEQVVATVVNQPPRTMAAARQARKAAASQRKAAVEGITTKPAEPATVTAGDALRGSLKAQEKATGKVQDQAARVIQREIVRAHGVGVKEGIAKAKAALMPIMRQLRESASRQRSMAEIEKRGAVDAVQARQAEVEAIRETIRNLAMDLPPAIRGQFLTAVKDATTPLRVAREVRRMSRALSRYEAGIVVRKLARWGKPAKLRALTNDRRSAVRMMLSTAARDWGIAKSKDTSATEMYAAAERLKATYNAVREQFAEHQAETRAIKALREQTAKEAATEAVANIEAARPPLPVPEAGKDIKTNPMIRLRRGAMDLLNALQTVEGKHDGTGVLERVFHRAMTTAEDRYFTEKRKATEAIDKAVRRAGFANLREAFEALSPAGGKASEQFIEAELAGQTRKIALGQAISLAAIDSQTEDLIDKGMKIQMRDGRFRTPIKVTMDEVDALRAQLVKSHPELLRMVKDFKAIMDGMRPAVFRVHRILKGFEPEIVPDRWPRIRNLSAGEKTQSLPESSHELVNRVLENSGFLKERTGGTDAPMLVDHVLNVVFDQVDQSAKVMHLAIPVRDAAAVLLDTRVRTAIADRWGGNYYTNLKQMLMAASRANQVLNTRGARIVHALNAALATRHLATNLGTYGRQIAGAVRLLPYFSAKDWVHGVTHALSVSVDTMARKSGYFWDRYVGNAAGRMSAVLEDGVEDKTTPALVASQRLALRNAVRNDWRAAYRAQLNVGRAVLQTVNWFDSLVARSAWAAAENQAKREHPEWSPAQRDRWVAQKAADVVRDTQNGSSPLDLSISAALNRDSGMAAFFLFSSDTFKTRNRLARAFKQSTAEGMKQVAAEAVSISLGIAFARAAGWGTATVIASALGADDRRRRELNKIYWAPEKLLADFLRQSFGAVAPLGAPVVSDLALGTSSGGITPPALEAINRIVTLVQSSANALKRGNADKFVQRIGEAGYEIFNAAGLNPFGWFTDKIVRELKSR